MSALEYDIYPLEILPSGGAHREIRTACEIGNPRKPGILVATFPGHTESLQHLPHALVAMPEILAALREAEKTLVACIDNAQREIDLRNDRFAGVPEEIRPQIDRVRAALKRARGEA